MRRARNDKILFGSISLFAILVAIAAVISSILASKLDETIANMDRHSLAMETGTDILPSHDHSIPSMARQISGLRPINYGIIVGSLAMLCGTLAALVWSDRQRREKTRLALESAALAEDLRVAEESNLERITELELLFDLCGTFAAAGTIEQMAQRIVQRLTVLPGADWVTLRLSDESDQRLRLLAAAGNVAETTQPLLSLTSRETLACRAFRSGKPVVVNDYPADPNSSPAILDLGMKSMALIPITANGHTLGLVNVISKDIGSFPADRVRLFSAVVDGIGPLFEIARLESQRRQEQELLKETVRLASIGQLAAGVAHELNNPLTSVLGYSQMMLASDVPESLKADLRIVVSESQRAAKVIEKLQLFARKDGPEKSYVNVNSIIQRAVDLKTHDLSNSDVKITCDLGDSVPNSMIDENQLVQVIVNILTNAEQSIAATHKSGRVSIQSFTTQGRIEIRIKDNGPGIPKDHLGKIFEPFFTTKEVGAGTGLGLSICYGIVEQHGGLLWAESAEGQGATFHIELPISSDRDNSESLDQLAPTLSPQRDVLAVEDEPAIRTLIRRSLELGNISVDMARDGAEAWQMLQTKLYDCILIDLRMPVMNGEELYQLIEKSRANLTRRVIFITGDTGNPKTHDFLSSTGNQIINKPFQMDELRTHIEQLIDNEG